MRTILVVGGGYAGFYTAWRLEKKLHRGEARIVVVDPRPYMTYQPFLPEVLAGSVEARHAAVSLRRHLRRARIVSGAVTAIDHAHRTVTVHPAEGPDFALGYDVIAVTAGAVTRRLAIPGVAEQAIGPVGGALTGEARWTGTPEHRARLRARRSRGPVDR